MIATLRALAEGIFCGLIMFLPAVYAAYESFPE